MCERFTQLCNGVFLSVCMCVQWRSTRRQRVGNWAVEQRRSLGQTARHPLDSACHHQTD